MQWCPYSRQWNFNFIMVVSNPSPNSNLCVSPLLEWHTWLPRIHCLLILVTPLKQVRRSSESKQLLIRVAINRFTSRGCRRTSASSFRSSTRMNKFLFRLKLTLKGYTYRQWKSCKKGSFLVVVRKSKAWNWNFKVWELMGSSIHIIILSANKIH